MYCPLPELGFNYNDCAGTGNISFPVGVRYPRAWKHKVKWQLQPSSTEPILAIHPKCSGLETKSTFKLPTCTWHCKINIVFEATTATHGAPHHGITGLEGTNTDDLIHYYPVPCHEASLSLLSDRWVHWLPILIGAGDTFVAACQVSGCSPIHLTLVLWAPILGQGSEETQRCNPCPQSSLSSIWGICIQATVSYR